MSNELENLRKQINSIDNKLLALIAERSSRAEQVLAAKIKAANGKMPEIFVPEREHKIIARLIAQNKSALTGESIANIFQTIINVCRNLQIDAHPKKERFKVSVQGIKGSFSEQAAIKFFKRKTLLNYCIDYAVSSDNVLKNLTSGKVHYGIVALNNAQGGLVSETINALSKYKYRIIDSVIILVEHSLLALSGMKKEKIKNVYSHPQALSQCRDYLKREYLHCKQIPWADTALSANDLATGKLDENSAIIAHARCAKENNLTILDDNIQDLKDNETFFLVIKAAPKNEH